MKNPVACSPLVGSESCNIARMVPVTEAPAMSPEEKSTPGPLSASASLIFRWADRLTR